MIRKMVREYRYFIIYFNRNRVPQSQNWFYDKLTFNSKNKVCVLLRSNIPIDVFIPISLTTIRGRQTQYVYIYFLLCPLFDFLYFSNDVEIESFTLLKKHLKKQVPALLVYSPGDGVPGPRPVLGFLVVRVWVVYQFQ